MLNALWVIYECIQGINPGKTGEKHQNEIFAGFAIKSFLEVAIFAGRRIKNNVESRSQDKNRP
jgi:hypothetical protein